MPCNSRLIILLILTSLISACSDAPSDKQLEAQNSNAKVENKTEQSKATPITSDSSQLFHSINKLSQEKFTELQSCARNFEQEAITWSKQPSSSLLLTLQASWLECHNLYLSTRLFRIWPRSLEILHPELDVPQTSPKLIHSSQSRIDHYPLIPGYLDSVPGYPLSGLIHSDIELNESTLHQEHQLGDSSYVTLGFHALAFMLFGGEGGPTRLATDFEPLSSSNKEASKRRRTRYVLLLCQILLRDIEKLSEAWLDKDSFYPNRLLELSEKQLKESLSQASEVELEAVTQIQQALNNESARFSHDNATSLKERKLLAQEVIALLLLNEQD